LNDAKVALDSEESLGYQVRRCHRRFDRLLNAYLSRHGLKTGFWYYLRVLWIEDDLNQRKLSDLTNVAENTTVAMINGMAQSGLVVRTRDSEDKRKIRVTLTPKGRRLEAEMMGYAVEINRVACAGIDPGEIETCKSVLRRMSANLQTGFDELAAPVIVESGA
jgi:DNA-binding MarR family transcriptional regulator